MPVSIPRLREEITTDPQGMYAGLSPADIARVINDPQEGSATRTVRVRRRDAKVLLLQRGKLLRLVKPAVAGKQQAEADLLAQIEFLLSDPDFQDIDFSSAETTGLMNALVAAGHLTQADVSAVQALGKQPISRAMELFGEPVTDEQIVRALEA